MAKRQSLAERLGDKGSLDPAEGGELLLAVCDALIELHGRNERAPGLTLGQVELEGEAVRLLPTTTEGSAEGAWKAPEESGDDADARADLYRLGVLAHRVLTGKLPPQGKLPVGALRATVGRLLSRSPDERYADAAEAREALADAVAETTGDLPFASPEHIGTDDSEAHTVAVPTLPPKLPTPGAKAGKKTAKKTAKKTSDSVASAVRTTGKHSVGASDTTVVFLIVSADDTATRDRHFTAHVEPELEPYERRRVQVGDGKLLIAFDEPLPALRLARAVVERVKQAGVALSLRVGVARGSARTDGKAVFGEPVNVAMGLAVAAYAGEVLVGSATFEGLAEGTYRAELLRTGAVEGAKEEVEIHRLLRAEDAWSRGVETGPVRGRPAPAPPGRGTSLGSKVIDGLGTVAITAWAGLQGLWAWAREPSRRPWVLGAAALLVLIVGWNLVSDGDESGEGGAKGGGFSISVGGPSRPSGLARETREQVAAGDANGAVARLEPAVTESDRKGGDAHLHAALAHAYVHAGYRGDAVPHYEWASKQDVDVIQEVDVDDLVNLLTLPGKRTLQVEDVLLRVGRRARGPLEDVWNDEKSRPVLRRRAGEVLHAMGEDVDLVPVYAAMLEHGECRARRYVASRLRHLEGEGVIDLLQKMASSKQCGAAEASTALRAMGVK